MSVHLPTNSYRAELDAFSQLFMPPYLNFPPLLFPQIAASNLSREEWMAAATAGSSQALNRNVEVQFPLELTADVNTCTSMVIDSQDEVDFLSRNIAVAKKRITNLKTMLCSAKAAIRPLEEQMEGGKKQVLHTRNSGRRTEDPIARRTPLDFKQAYKKCQMRKTKSKR